jgi:hypothetical protein
MPKRMLVTLPEHDMTTYYISRWGSISIAHAKEQGISVTELGGEKANRQNVEGYLSKLQFNVVLLNGHGNDKTVMGHDNHPVIMYEVNESSLKGTITYAISCSSAKVLGDSSIKSGALAYIGYDQDFTFMVDENHYTRPLEDMLAALFLRHTSVFMNSLFKGNTVKESYEKAKESLRESIIAAEASGNRGALSWLVWDYYAFKINGEGGSRL